ncbi:MAG: Plug domain-containing protein, partial [Alphaproteobacteria bacterium]
MSVHYRKPALLLSTILGAAALTPLGAGQPARAQETAITAEEITIVGSRIKRRDATTNSPVLTLSESELEDTGLVSIGEILQELPAVGFSLNSNGSAGVSHGTASVNLRNLGANRSLILVNGHRW